MDSMVENETVASATVPVSLSGSAGVSLVTVIIGGISAWLLYLLLKHLKTLQIVVQTLPRDLRGVWFLARTLLTTSMHQRRRRAVADVFDEIARKISSKTCLQFDKDEWTFGEVRDLSNQVAHYFQAGGYKKGDIVALFMENRPEYLCIWLGLSRLGVTTCLINSNLRQTPLRHSFDIVDIKAIVYGNELADAIKDVFSVELETKASVPLFSAGSFKRLPGQAEAEKVTVTGGELERSSQPLEFEMKNCPKTNPVVLDKPGFADSLFYMYTSGTTGLPKAAIVNHARYLIASTTIHYLNMLKPEDIIYTCLPLYHTAAGICGVGQALLFGNTIILRPKFSASRFWADCIDHKVTVAQYIGEICRYLLSQPPSDLEKQHKIRLLMGNGLRPEIWPEFLQRFSIPRISEMYGSTDGNCNMGNFDGRVGAVGFVPVLLKKLVPMTLIRVDEVTGQVLRDPESGLALQCQVGEAGELVGKIVENHPVREFKGYAGKDKRELNEKKIMRDVYVKGDLAFRTGDYLVMDELGYFYFKDRWGDTFRWKGENVSTAEVETVISNVCGLKDCVVYGVKVPGTEGRAGMAAIADPDGATDLDLLAAAVVKSLPVYARPLFLRVSSSIEITGTYKMKKYELQQDAFDLGKVKEPLYFFNGSKYIRLDEQLFSQIQSGKIRL